MLCSPLVVVLGTQVLNACKHLLKMLCALLEAVVGLLVLKHDRSHLLEMLCT